MRLLSPIALLAAATAVLADPAATTGQSLLLLRNGEILEGQVSRDGERYIVAIENGELRIPARDVDFQCDTIDQAYQMQSKRIAPQQLDERLKLAEWCLRHNLYDRAAGEITTAKLLDPRHPKVQLLDRRLQELQSTPLSDRASADELRRESRPAESDAPRRANAPMAGEDLERFARSLPAGTVESFSMTTQPLILKHCGTAGCHGVGSKSDLVLLRPSPGTGVARRVTLRNLHTLMRWVDYDTPEESSLLKRARQPHGTGAGAATENLAATELEQLQAWATLATKGNKAVPAASAQNMAPVPSIAPLGTPAPEAPVAAKRASASPLANVTAFPGGAGWRNAISPPHGSSTARVGNSVAMSAAAPATSAPAKKPPVLDKPSTAQTPADLGIAPLPPLPDEAPKDAKESVPLQSEKAPHAGFDPNAFRPDFKAKPK
jgi:hypothetical protein